MATPAEVVAEERGRAEQLSNQFITLVQEAAAELYAAVVASPVVDVRFNAVQEPALVQASALRTTLEARLAGGTGLSATVEAGIWDRAREREAATAQAQADEATLQDEALGFDFPTGALNARLEAVGQEYHNKVSSINRDIAIKQAELEQQNLRDTIAALQALYGFIVTQDVEHWKALISQNEAIQNFVLQAAGLNANILNSNRATQLDAAKTIAQTFAQLAASAIGRVGVSASVSGSGSTSVSYNYSNDTTGAVTPITQV